MDRYTGSMVTGIIGRKVGMTQVFGEDGTVEPVTVIKAGPCVVVQAKTAAARRLRGRAARPRRGAAGPRVDKPIAGHYKKAGVPPTRVRREVKLAPGGERAEGRATRCSCRSFADGERVDVDRHEPRQGLPGRHQAPPLRAAARRRTARCSTARPARSAPPRIPSRVIKGMRAAGRMGGERVTTRNLRVVQGRCRATTCCSLRGAIPGAPGGYVIVRKAVAAKRPADAAGREAEEGQEVGIEPE